MCGILGWIDYKENLEDKFNVLNRIANTLNNRGPDSKGTWISNNAIFAHRRLSVIDPVNGMQPMVVSHEGNTYVIVYNGELYNTNELRSILKLKGYHFNTDCDTEVLLNAFIEWKEDCVNRLNGIFAFGVWDVNNQNLFMARDRFGVKPLFFTEINNSFLFASELKALLKYSKVNPYINDEGLAEIFLLGPSRTPGNGVFKNIYELKPGHSLIFNNERLLIKKYWSLDSHAHEDSIEETIEKVRYLIIDSIQRQLVSDVPLCTFLSGGIDSSAITSIASRYYSKNNLGNLNTYSIDYVDNDLYYKPNYFQPNSDKPYIDLVSQYSSTIHHNIVFGIPELVEALDIATTARDLPGMADIDSSLYLFCKEIKNDFTVALSGECADEVFGGYPWFNDSEINVDTFPWLRFLDGRLKYFSAHLLNLINPHEYIRARYLDTLKEVPRLEGESKIDARRREIFYLTMNWFMATLLDRKDRMSMACGLEVRVPFCDHRIVEYAWNIPWEMKRYNNQEKGIMRAALKGLLPDEILNRKKSPYPKTHNPLYKELVGNKLLSIIEDSTSPILDFINIEEITNIINSKVDAFTKPWFGQLMTGPQFLAYLIQVNNWMKEYKVKIK